MKAGSHEGVGDMRQREASGNANQSEVVNPNRMMAVNASLNEDASTLTVALFEL